MGVVTMLMTFVVPRIAEQFTGMGMALPLLTRIMIGLSGALQAGWPFIAAGFVVLIAGGALALRQAPGSHCVRRVLGGTAPAGRFPAQGRGGAVCP